MLRASSLAFLVVLAACAKGTLSPTGSGGNAGSAGSGGDAGGGGAGGSGGSAGSAGSGNSGNTGGSAGTGGTGNAGGSGGSGAGASGGSGGVAGAGGLGGSGGLGGAGGAGGAGGSGGAMMCPGAPTNVTGCAACGGACDSPWPLSWDPVPGATSYNVKYQCFMGMPVFASFDENVDLCMEVGMCNDGMCAFGVGPVQVQACDGNCCSAWVTAPAAETPIACGGGVCC